MKELILILLDKIENNTYVVVALIVVIAAYYVIIHMRSDYIYRKPYVKAETVNVFKIQTRKMIYMFVPIMIITHLLYLWSALIHKDTEFHLELYVTFYIPFLILTMIRDVRRLKRDVNESWVKRCIFLLPGASFHVLYLLFIWNAKKNIWILALIILCAAILPSISQYVLMYLISDKDKKMIELKMKNGKIYHNSYKDVIDDGKGDFISIRVRNSNGEVKKIVKVRREDIESQKIYLKKKK